MTRRLILEGWNRFAADALPPGATPNQREAVRITYCAGAVDLFEAILDILEGANDPTAADIAQMNAVRDEIRAFKVDVLARGRGTLSQ
jgi:hypothetical protein